MKLIFQELHKFIGAKVQEKCCVVVFKQVFEIIAYVNLNIGIAIILFLREFVFAVLRDGVEKQGVEIHGKDIFSIA